MRRIGRYSSMYSRPSRMRKLMAWEIRPTALIPSASIVLHELNDQRDHERVDGDGFREDDRQDHVLLDRRSRFGVAADRIHRPSGEEADAHAGADGTQADGDRGCDESKTRVSHACYSFSNIPFATPVPRSDRALVRAHRD